MNVRFKVRGLEEVQAFLKQVPRGTVRVALRAIGEYILGDERRGLRHNDPYKYVSRAKAYGSVSDAPDGYFSWAQFRYVMAKISEGEIQPGSPHRTNQAAESYSLKETNDGYSQAIVSNDTGAYYTRDDDGQARQPAAVGWRKVSKVIADNLDGALRHANAAINKFLKSKG